MANGKNSNKGMDSKEEVLIGAGLAALAAGAYFFLGPKGKKHQKQMRGWMVKMKGEVLEKLEEAKEITEPIYNDIVDSVAKTNAVAGKIPQAEIKALAADLKRQWRSLNRSLKGQRRSGTAKRAPKRATTKRKTSTRTSNKSQAK
jgi:hypothetical protein